MGTEILTNSVPLLGSSALLTIMTGIAVSFIGIMFVVREGGARSSLPFLALAQCAALWLFAEGMASGTSGAQRALQWYQIAAVGAACFPLAFAWFTHRVAGPVRFALPLRHAGVAVTALLVIGALASPLFISGVTETARGYQMRFGPVGTGFSILFVAAMCAIGAVYATQLKRHGNSDYRHRRARVLLVASVVGAGLFSSFLPALGVAYFLDTVWIMGCFFALTGYVNARYRSSDITPALIGRQIANVMPEPLLVLDRNGQVHQINPAARRFFGVSTETATGRSSRRLLGQDALRQPINDLIEGRAVDDFELDVLDGSKRKRTLSISCSAVREFDESPHAFVFILRDISPHKISEERIRQLAYVDALTQLPNRAGFCDSISQHIDSAPDARIALMFLDLDRFKLVNDNLGHDAGDKMLTVIARRLIHSLRKDSAHRHDDDLMIARLGGDEFVIALYAAQDQIRVREVCERVLRSLSQPIDLGGQEVFSGASIGVSRFPEDGQCLQSLLKCADLALYDAKDAGRNTFRFYDAEMSARFSARARLEADIRMAAENEEFSVHFQPIVDHRTRTIVGAEALLRWHHARRGMVRPDEFVPVAEDMGLMSMLGDFVLRTACTELNRWQELGLTHLNVAVNVSEHQFRRDTFSSSVQRCLDDFGIDPRRLILELTESVVMNGEGGTRDSVRALKQLGIRIGIDDFGTGYSSFSSMEQLGVDMVKVDGRFTRAIANEDDASAVAQAIIGMARNLNLQVIAEGVEDEAQAERLLRANCSFMQGYLYGAPMPADDIFALLEAEAVNDQPNPTLTLPQVSSTRH
ncbi:MAG: putative bifunctional diguanylate cyclase/phosphodiesterase [Gammaproteobacteria bacterium]